MGNINRKTNQAAIRGLQKGVVEEVQNDPEGKNRVLVQIAGSSTILYAALASPAFPQQGDEVIVGFFNDDPNDAVILGVLGNSTSKPSAEPGEAGKSTGPISYGGMKIHFHEETESMVIETTAGNHISLDQKNGSILIEDANSNSVILSRTGIFMESSRDITLRASGVLTLEAGSVKLRADGKLKAEGAEAEVSTSGRMVLKGSLVTIN